MPKSFNYLFSIIALSACFFSCSRKDIFTIKEKSTEDNATLIVIAYPNDLVRTTPSLYSYLLPFVGMGSGDRIRAGHACMVLAKEGSETLEYYDFGRYMTPYNYSRMRSVATDPEVAIEVKAKWDGKKLTNVTEIIQWLYDHPEKTHGYSELYASVSENVNYERVTEYVNIFRKKGLMEYGPFQEDGSNCARFVTGAMYHGILDEEIHDEVRNEYLLTPSGLGNVDAANSYEEYYVVNEDSLYKSDEDLGWLQRRIIFDFGEDYPEYCPIGSVDAPINVDAEDDWKWLGGIGSGVWYEIEPTSDKQVFIVSQYNKKGKCVFSTYFKAPEAISLKGGFQIDYPSNFAHVTINVGGEKVKMFKMPGKKRYQGLDYDTTADK